MPRLWIVLVPRAAGGFSPPGTSYPLRAAPSALFKKYEFKPEFKQTDGGHVWINWQLYLNEFAPKLFK